MFLQNIHPEWRAALIDVLPRIEEIENSLDGTLFLPPPDQVLRSLERPLSQVRVVIFGQDPYPTPGHANGLAFSVAKDVKTLPKSLRNIFIELNGDIGCPFPEHGDLSHWADQGVALINRVLTVPNGESNGHINLGWQKVTDEIARVLGERDIVAILWGKNAGELSRFFRNEWIIASAHPSPLSAHRGFFGSRPFSRANRILREHGLAEMNWCR